MNTANRNEDGVGIRALKRNIGNRQRGRYRDDLESMSTANRNEDGIGIRKT